MAGTFIVDNEFTIGEQFSYTLYAIAQTKMVRRMFILGTIVGGLRIPLNLIAPIPVKYPWYYWVIEPFIVPCFLTLFFTLFSYIFILVHRKLKPLDYKKATYRFTNGGMEKTSVQGNFSTPWNKFIKFRETRHFLLIYVTGNIAQVIQKRMFKDKGEFEAFKQLVALHLKAG